MLTKKEKTFSIVFFIILIIELICGSTDSLLQLHYITKPSIVLSLLVFFWMESRSILKSIRNLTLLALGFSLLGDVFLMFVDHSPKYFMFGLVAFLLAHIMYILVFLKHRNPKKRPLLFLVFLLIYASGLFLLLKNGLGEMLVPVLIYMLVILAMAMTTFLREGKVSKTNYAFVTLGAILFLVSDSLLAINKFYESFEIANILIMLTYGLAQYFIVFGIKNSS
ncbi:MAG: lysoplasmalogenase [Aquaticitalea sp.]